MTFLNASLRRSLPKRWAALEAKAAERMPNRPPTAVRPSIRMPVEMMSARSWPMTPWLTIFAMSLGCIRSIATSPIMESGARIAKIQ